MATISAILDNLYIIFRNAREQVLLSSFKLNVSTEGKWRKWPVMPSGKANYNPLGSQIFKQRLRKTSLLYCKLTYRRPAFLCYKAIALCTSESLFIHQNTSISIGLSARARRAGQAAQGLSNSCSMRLCCPALRSFLHALHCLGSVKFILLEKSNSDCFMPTTAPAWETRHRGRDVHRGCN